MILKKLDKKTGSRNRNGNVPNVNWNLDNRKVYVNYYNPDNSDDNLRSRSEVSLSADRQESKGVFKTPFVLNLWKIKI